MFCVKRLLVSLVWQNLLLAALGRWMERHGPGRHSVGYKVALTLRRHGEPVPDALGSGVGPSVAGSSAIFAVMEVA
jgi:hypothetical protein